MSFVPNAGFSKAFGDGSSFSTYGFSVGANAFYTLSDNISVGGHVVYNRLFASGQRLAGLFGRSTSGVTIESTAGGYSIVEVVPSILITPQGPAARRGMRIAFQVGAGMYVLKFNGSTKTAIEGQPGQIDGIGVETSWRRRPGVNFGLALSFKRWLLIQPLFTFILGNGKLNERLRNVDGFDGYITKYFSVNVGFLFGK